MKPGKNLYSILTVGVLFLTLLMLKFVSGDEPQPNNASGSNCTVCNNGNSTPPPNCDDPPGSTSPSNSFVNNGTMRYGMTSTDYSFSQSSSGSCSPCGTSSISDSNQLPSLSLDRNTFISVTEVLTSFGDRSGFAKYDDVLVFQRNTNEVEFRSPGEQTI